MDLSEQPAIAGFSQSRGCQDATQVWRRASHCQLFRKCREVMSSSSIPTQAQSDQHNTLEWKVLDEPMAFVTTNIRVAQKPNTIHNTHRFLLTNGNLCHSIQDFHERCPETSWYLKDVYTLHIPNYTGSVGFGQTHTQKLLIHCRSTDIEDVVASVELVRQGISEERRVVMGGSYGGFIAVHFIGQHPTLFNVTSLRNPVISPGEMAIGTDILDGVYSEFGIPSTFDSDFLTSPASDPPCVARARLPHAHTLPNDADTNDAPTPHLNHNVPRNLPNRLHRIPNRTHPQCEDGLRGRSVSVGRTSTGSGIRNENENETGDGNRDGKDGNWMERNRKEGKDGILEMLSFAGETHSIEGVGATRVSREAIRDWFKVFAEGGWSSWT
ncbi:hypothetical protein EDB19DRAFT_1964966 [Suillus lakei]|nr:hypothetical protein EDB19DRAFT_1964966 [Suillus lakei]